jgi:RPA family protein
MEGPDAAVSASGMTASRIFVAGTLQALQMKLNCAAA